MATPTTRGRTPPQSGRIGQQSATSAVVPQAYADAGFPGIAFTNQLAINLTHKTLAYYDTNGAWQEILGGADIQSYYGPVAPSVGVQAGDRWFDTTTLMWNLWDPDVGGWMVGDLSYSSTAPDSPSIGQAWFNTTTRVLSFWNGTAWVLGSDATAPGSYSGGLPASATAGSTWTDSDGVAWICTTGYTSGGTKSNWTRAIYRVDPLAQLITGKAIVATEATSAPTPDTTTPITTGLIWLDMQPGSANVGNFYIWNGSAWKRVFAPNTIELCLAIVAASSYIRFINTDSATATGPGAIAVSLTQVPIDGSVHVYWNGLAEPPTQWTQSGKTVTIPDASGLIRAGDVFSVAYAWRPGAAPTKVPYSYINASEFSGGSGPAPTTSIAMPTGAQAGDLLVVAAMGGFDGVAGGHCNITDSRVTLLDTGSCGGRTTKVAAGVLGSDFSAIQVDVQGSNGYATGQFIEILCFLLRPTSGIAGQLRADGRHAGLADDGTHPFPGLSGGGSGAFAIIFDSAGIGGGTPPGLPAGSPWTAVTGGASSSYAAATVYSDPAEVTVASTYTGNTSSTNYYAAVCGLAYL